MGNVIIAIAMGVVVLILCAGLFTLWRGGDTARTWSNKLMRLRVLAQFITILLVIAVVYFTRH